MCCYFISADHLSTHTHAQLLPGHWLQELLSAYRSHAGVFTFTKQKLYLFMVLQGVRKTPVSFRQSHFLSLQSWSPLLGGSLHRHLRKPSLAQLRTTGQLLRFVSRGRSELKTGGRNFALHSMLGTVDVTEPQDSLWVLFSFTLEVHIWALSSQTNNTG